MSILIVGSSSGLGKEIFEQLAEQKSELSTISRYSNTKVYETQRSYSKKAVKCDLTNLSRQTDFDDITKELPKIEQLYFSIGGGLGRKDILPALEDIELVYKLNLYAPICLLRSLNKNLKIDSKTKICFISSIASNEVIASPAYSSAKAALNTYCKTATKQQDNQFGSITNFLCGAFEGNGSAFNRLKERNNKAYNTFIEQRLPHGRPLSTKELASYIIATMEFSKELLDGMTIKVDGNESFSI